MASIINTNIASLTAQRNLSSSQSSLQTSLQRLSSGLRINSAKDDAAGMAISNRMTSQINGLDQAARNANDGISLSQTAEGGLSTASDLLQRMRTLAVQAANGTNSSSDRASIQSEVSQLQQELNRVANTTQFNGQNILDGSLNNAQFQVGANANQTINFSIGSAQATAIGSNTVGANAATTATTLTQAHAGAAKTIPANVFLAQALTVQGNGTSVTIPNTTLIAGSNGHDVAAAVNSASSTTGVTASATTSATLSGFAAGGGSVSLTLQGATSSTGAANPVTISATMANGNDVSGLAAAINAQTGSTGITAVADTTNGTIGLTQAQGYDIGVLNNTAQTGITLTGTTSTGAAGTGVALTASGSNGDAATVGAAVTFSGPSAFTVSSDTATSGIFDTANAAVGSQLSSVAAIDVTKMSGGTPTGANSALSVIDAALANIDSARASMGAIQNRFQSTISNLQTTSENLSASRSRIQDTDFAAETANLTKSQILQQAGTAMLSQANQLPQQVLSLLK
ncbi:MAG: flagellin [Rouxiella aceris]|uniref:flagellin N-terminal helical domain-containing protein n=1 Tax=Rouxiella aceris TaxID=2703884 RepID=UPI002845142F|nr:flagellin [Rouxiella aceris]MDR3432232.1 flagellin [Rouxiella aceris]